MNYGSIEQRVDRGARFLEQVLGPRWYAEVEVERLDMSDTCRCVLGQSLGWGAGTDTLEEHVGFDNADYGHMHVLHGFDSSPIDDTVDYDTERVEGGYERLKAAWVEKLAEARRLDYES